MTQRQATVLVVEDTDALRRLVAYVLGKAGLRVLEAEDGERAWEILQTDRPDLVLLDVRMPRMDGLDLLERIRGEEALAGLKVVMLTSLGTEADIARARGLGISGYLIKPVPPKELVTRVRALIAEETL